MEKQISKLSQILSVLLGLVIIATPMLALAQYSTPNCGGFGVACGGVFSGNISTIIIRIIQILLSLAGLIAVLVLIIGGFRYVTSFGNDDQVKQAKGMIINAIIGIIIIILSFVIVQVITNVLNRAGSGTGI